jgi:hypothetical protein
MRIVLIRRSISDVLLCVAILVSEGSVSAASVDGNALGIFMNPRPSTAVVSGVGTNFFSWGIPFFFGTSPSSLRFTGNAFSVQAGQFFSIGTLQYFNGTLQEGTEANQVDLKITIMYLRQSRRFVL